MVKKVILLLALGIIAVAAVVTWGRPARNVAAALSGPNIGGKLAFVRNGSIWLYTDGNAEQLTAGPEDKDDKRDAYPSFSPDGLELVYTRLDEGFSDLYKLDLTATSQPVALTDNRPQVEVGAVGIPGITDGYNDVALWAMQPAWSPDGNRIAYISDVGTEYPGLFSMDTQGARSRKLESLNHGIQGVERPQWSPDGARIAVTNYVTDGGKGQIWSLNLSTGKWTEITNATDGAYDPAWSPDSEWLAFTMRQGTRHNIYVVPTDAEQWEDTHPTPIQLTTDGASRSPAWSPTSDRLAYISKKDNSFELFAGAIQLSTNSEPSLSSIEKLTDKANLDATAGISWGR